MTVWATEGLADAVLDLAEEHEPTRVSAHLGATAAGDLEGAESVPPEAAVFTDLYVPTANRATDAVFGIEMTIPNAQTQGRFVSHPRGAVELTSRDPLHAVVFVAAPPWDRSNLAVFDRSGTRKRLKLLPAVPPTETLRDP